MNTTSSSIHCYLCGASFDENEAIPVEQEIPEEQYVICPKCGETIEI